MLSREEIGVARLSPLLSETPEDAATSILRQAERKRFERGSPIFEQDEAAHSVFIVLSGRVKLCRVSRNGAEAVVDVLSEGRSFGESALALGGDYPVSAEAVTDCRLLQVKSGVILGMMRSRPDLCAAMLAVAARHMSDLYAQIEQLKAHTGAQRAADFLLGLCPVGADACTVNLPYEKVLIAGRLGMKPESLSRAFAQLRGAGVVVRRNSVAISNRIALEDYVARDPALAWSQAL